MESADRSQSQSVLEAFAGLAQQIAAAGTALAESFPFVRLVEPVEPGAAPFGTQEARPKREPLDERELFGRATEELIRGILCTEGRICLPERVVARGCRRQETAFCEYLRGAAVRIGAVETLSENYPEPQIQQGIVPLESAARMLRPHFYVEQRLILVGWGCPPRSPTGWSVGNWDAFDEGPKRVIFITFEELFEKAAAMGLKVPDRMPGVDRRRVLWHNVSLAAPEIGTAMAGAFERALAPYPAVSAARASLRNGRPMAEAVRSSGQKLRTRAAEPMGMGEEEPARGGVDLQPAPPRTRRIEAMPHRPF